MKAAYLGHQFLNVKAINENEVGRFRSGRKYQRKYSKQQQQENNIPASDPLSRRSVAINEQSQENVPPVAIYGRSYSESNNMYVVYEQHALKNADFQHSDRGIHI